MNPSSVLNMLGRMFALFTLPGLLCAFWAFGNDRYPQASLFILVTTASAVIGAVLLVSTPSRSIHKAGLKEIVGFLTLSWAGLSVIGALPFLTVSNGDPISALFESVSCLTTTGTSLISPEEPLPASLIAWRGILHLTGAMLAISGTLLLVTSMRGLGQGLRKLQAIGIGTRLNFASFMNILLVVAAVLLVLTIIPMVVLILEGMALRDAFALAVGASTTGQVYPFHHEVLGGHAFGAVLVCMALFLASMSTATLLMYIRSPFRTNFDAETVGLLAIMLGLTGLIFVFSADADLQTAFLWAFSISSTSGLLLEPESAAALGWPLIIFFGFVGGAAVSATGGIKLFRMRLLMARAGVEFSRLAQPNSVLRFSLSGTRNPVESMLTVWVYLIGFAVVMISLAGYLAMTGMSFEASVSTAVGAITNSASLFHAENMNMVPGILTKLILTISMILGRLELLLLLAFIIRN